MPVTKVKSKWNSSGDLAFTNNTGTERFRIKNDGAPTVAGKLGGATFTVGAESSNVINVAIQLNDGNGDALATRASVYAYLSDDANGDSIAATAPATSVAIGTDGVLDEITAKKSWMLTSESDGDIDIDITETGADTWYLVVVLPDGSLTVSGAITFA